MLSLESRLKLQQDNQIGLYSQDYESKEKQICIATEPKEEALTDILPIGFKKTDSWISIDHNPNEKGSTVLAENSLDKLDESEEDLDGVPLYASKSSSEESEEDLDGEPLNLY